ncbi:1-phosphofructokinase family hexose kinase [Actinoplanes sp. NPDC049265]|uniref:1-phosphofructokinase family hexose kinase n=1 Tax=Actinoplanes sp. NPDC049265 TaxID=3363902 RepID=UPI003719E446
MTLNPALDLTYTVGALTPHTTHQVTAVAARPGGKGLNVATALHALGEPVLATGILGGTVGAQLTDLLQASGLPASFLAAPIESRRTVAVVDGRDATGFWEPGPHLPAPSWPAFLDHFRTLLPQASVVALCGSLPPGAPLDGYATLTLIAAEHDVPVILDTSGPALREGLSARPHLVKPNAAEATELTPDRSAGWRERADRVRSLGARAVVLSRGPEGLLAVTGDDSWEAAPPEVVAGNPTGAGDACVAALARGVRDGTPWPETLADAVALSAATVAAPTAGSFDRDTYHRLRAAAVVTPHPKES